MTWIAFARLNQAIEELSPTAAITQVKRSWDVFENKGSKENLLVTSDGMSLLS